MRRPIIILLLLALVSCSPRVITNTVVKRDTLYVANHVRDSIYFRDSIYIKEQLKGDTVYIREYRDRWRDRIKEVHDTVVRHQTDTVALQTTIEKKVEQPVKGWKKVRLRAFLPLLLLALVGWRRELLKLIKMVL